MEWTPIPAGLLSADGRYAIERGTLVEADLDYNPHVVILDLDQGTTRVLTLDGDILEGVAAACWDPQAPQFIYVDGTRTTKVGEPDRWMSSEGTWRVRMDGTQVTAVSRPGEETGLGSPLPDGRLVLRLRGPQGLAKYVTQLGTDIGSRQPADWASISVGILIRDPSPNGAFLAGNAYFAWLAVPDTGPEVRPNFAHGNLSVYEIATGRRAVLFTDEQMLLGLPAGTAVRASMRNWLPDSSGFLVSTRVLAEGEEKDRFGLWRVTLGGEARKLVDDVRVTGSSANGHHWIFEQGGKYYLVSVPEAAATAPAQ